MNWNFSVCYSVFAIIIHIGGDACEFWLLRLM